jgi:hypothetical protein
MLVYYFLIIPIISRIKIVFRLYRSVIGKFSLRVTLTFSLCILLSSKSVAYCANLNLSEFNSATTLTKVAVDTVDPIEIKTDEFSEKPTWRNQLFRDYDDRQCFKFSWLVNSSFSNIRLVSRNIEAFQVLDKNKAIDKIKNSNQVERKPNSFLAFNPNKKGHSGITTEALESIEQEVTGAPEPLQFSQQAIHEIVKANKEMDVEHDFFPSPGFYVPCIHFDNEQFHDASTRLIDLKTRIISLLTTYPRDGKQARYFLGAALHTIQDFYAHTNWVELGFTDIDIRLGREIIVNPPKDMYTSLKITKEESIEIYKKYRKNRPKSKLNRLRKPDYEKQYENDDNFRKLVNTIAAAKSDKPGVLLPDFVGTKDKKRLTSGYFMGIGSIESCTVPFCKTRHGVGFFGCPEGLNKDEPKRPGYIEARRLAVLASQDYINQILDTPQVSQHVQAIKVFMGIK